MPDNAERLITPAFTVGDRLRVMFYCEWIFAVQVLSAGRYGSGNRLLAEFDHGFSQP